MRSIVIIVFTFVFSGCFTVAQLQSPKVLEKGEIEIGVGGTLPYSGNSFELYELLGNLRVGVGENTEVGFRVFGKLEQVGKVGKVGSLEGWEDWRGWGGVYADVKHQFIKSPLYASGVLGLSYSVYTVGLYPSLIIGTDRFYTSIGATVIGSFDFDFDFSQGFEVWRTLARLATGYSFGDKVRLIPEIGFIYGGFKGEEKAFSSFYTALGISVRP